MKFVAQLIGNHLSRYPAMALPDVYKLLHQAALGPAHAVAGDAVAASLAQEMAALGDGPEEPLADVISPDGRLARIHLRPYRRAGLDAGALARAFAETAAAYPGSVEKLEKFCGCLGDLAQAGGLPFGRAEAESYVRDLREAGWPAVRHSAAYRDACSPAYRVVDLERLPGLPR